jgi:hypothetical protein
VIENDEGRGQRGMAAQIHFCHRRKPTDMVPVFVSNEEGCFRKVVFLRNGLEQIILKPFLQRANRRRISGKNAACKRVNLVDGELHGTYLDQVEEDWNIGMLE